MYKRQDIHHLFEVLEGKLRVIEPLPEPPRGAIGTELGDGILRGGNMTMLSMLCEMCIRDRFMAVLQVTLVVKQIEL